MSASLIPVRRSVAVAWLLWAPLALGVAPRARPSTTARPSASLRATPASRLRPVGIAALRAPAPAERPTFSGSLGTPRQVTRMFAGYGRRAASVRGLHPVADGPTYHNYQHTQNVAHVMYQLAAGSGLEESAARFLSEVALLHDVDPKRPPGTPARVAATLDWLGSPAGKALASEWGWSAEQMKMAEALIVRTEFPFAPAAERHQQLVSALGANRDFVVQWGAMLSEYADKASWYVGPPKEALEAVQGLSREAKFDAPATTSGFLANLGHPDSFAFDRKLSPSAKFPSLKQVLSILGGRETENFRSNQRMFDRIASGANPQEALKAAR